MKREDRKALIDLIKESKHIAIMGHKKGDGDSFGSALALKIALEKMGKKVEVVAEDGLPLHLDFLYQFFNFSIKDCLGQNTDLLICVDWSEISQAACPGILNVCMNEKSTKIAVIDHHVKGKFIEKVDAFWSEEDSCATAEIVFNLLKELEIEIDKNIATCLLTGIETDTSSYQNQNTNGSCFSVSAELMKHGARLQNIKKGINADKTVEVLKLWGIALSRLTFNKKYNTAVTYLSYEDAKNLGLSPSFINGPVNFLNSIKGAKMVVLITEEEPGVIKVSFRTRDEFVDVSKLARLLGGGGHVKASGLRFEGNLKIEKDLVKII